MNMKIFGLQIVAVIVGVLIATYITAIPSTIKSVTGSVL